MMVVFVFIYLSIVINLIIDICFSDITFLDAGVDDWEQVDGSAV